MSKAKRMSPAARAGLQRMAGYWLTCYESWGGQFEGLPDGAKEEAQINAALSYLGLAGIDFEAERRQEDEE